MRLLTFGLALLLFIAITAGVYGNPVEAENVAMSLDAVEQPLSLYDVEPQGHENEGVRLARQYGYDRYGGYSGGSGGGYSGGSGGGYRGGYRGGNRGGNRGGYRGGYYD